MKRALIGLTVAAAILAGCLLYISHLQDEADYYRQRLDAVLENVSQENETRTAEKRLHETICELHKGNAAALKLHGCAGRH